MSVDYERTLELIDDLHDELDQIALPQPGDQTFTLAQMYLRFLVQLRGDVKAHQRLMQS